VKIKVHNPNKLPTKEIWENIIKYEGYYQVSNLGSVRSLNRYVNSKFNNKRFAKGKLLKLNTDKDGYRTCVLCKDNKNKTCKVHRLVLTAFKENSNNYSMSNHLDGNKKNNYIDNLEWCNQSINEKHAHRIGLKNHKGENHSQSRLKEIDIKKIRGLRKTFKLKYNEIAKIFGINDSYAWEIVNRKAWSHIN